MQNNAWRPHHLFVPLLLCCIFGAISAQILQRLSHLTSSIDYSDMIPNTRLARSLPKRLKQDGIFNMMRSSADSKKKEIGGKMTIQMLEYQNPEFRMRGDTTCKCNSESTCKFLQNQNIASPCFFDFVIIAPADDETYLIDTDFIPFASSPLNISVKEFGKKVLYNVTTGAKRIDVVISQLGPVISIANKSLEYYDYLYGVDHFEFTLDSQNSSEKRNNGKINSFASTDFSRLREQPAVIETKTGKITNVTLQISYTLQCFENYYGRYCEIKCLPEKSANTAMKKYICKSNIDPLKVYQCTPTKNEHDILRMNNCTLCAVYNEYNETCVLMSLEHFDNSTQPYFTAIFFILIFINIVLIIILASLFVFCIRNKRKSQVYDDKEKFFSVPGTSSATGDPTKRDLSVGRHFSISHELPPTAVRRGLSPPRSPIYETSPSCSTTSDNIPASENASANKRNMNYSYGSPIDRKEALV